MRLSLCLGLLVFASYISAAIAHEERATQKHYPITGTHTGINRATGARPARRNILDLQNDEPIWSLYIQALSAMQNAPESDPLSYYQISGIHGRPYTSWDNVGPGIDTPLTGYCTHDSVLFPSWHRPYLALYEQVLAGHVQKIARTYSGSASIIYKTAADNFRVPYWDWASVPQMPDVVNAEKVLIMTPSGARNVSNPLLQYQFQTFPFDKKYFPPSPDVARDWYLASYQQTVRSPDVLGSGSNFAYANSVLEGANLKDQVYYALTKTASYDEFATEAVWGPSIENVHSVVHVSIGGTWGHMSQLSYSSFDPIFWLHHVNVDRLTALYQAMHPNSYLTPFPDYFGSFTLPGGGLYNDTVFTPLQPFSTDTDGHFYTSDTAKSLHKFGYSYPEIEDWMQTTVQLRENVTAQVNSLYGPPVSKSKRGISERQNPVKEWSVTIRVSKFDLDGQRFIIFLFLGDIPHDPSDWTVSDTCVGYFPLLPPVSHTRNPEHRTATHNEISLTEGLEARGYDGQNSTTVARYLEEALVWRVKLVNGTAIPTDQLESLSIRVHEGAVTWGDSLYELPRYGERTAHPQITKGKLGG